MTDAIKFAHGLRALADWYEAHPEQETPIATLNAFAEDRSSLIAIARALGSTTKNAGSDWFWLSRDFGGGVVLQVNVKRGVVCERRVVGTRIVPASLETTEEIVEWDCGKLMEEIDLRDGVEEHT